MGEHKKYGRNSRRRRGELGNVFFTLFGAVAVVGVLGAGIMATMRGPLSTMVEVNRREQAKSELQVAASLVLSVATDDYVEDTCEGGGPAAVDGYTEGPPPTAGTGPTGGGLMPSVGATQTDPWGNAYGYCVWDHGPDAAGSDGGCTGYLAGTTSTNREAIAVISAGPNGVFDTTCGADPTYISPTGGGADDIVVSKTYDQAITGSGGLWNLKSGDPNVAEINKNLEVTGSATFTDVLDLTGSPSAQLQLGAASLLLPNQITTPNTDCNGANAGMLRFNTIGGSVEVCDGTNFVNSGSYFNTNANGIDYGGGNVGIGVALPNDALDVAGSAQITGATSLDGAVTAGSTLGVTGATTLTGSLTANSTSAFNDSVVITSTATDTTPVLTINQSGPSEILRVQSDGNVGIGDTSPNDALDVSGAIDLTETLKIDGINVVNNGTGTDTILLGQDAGADVTGDNNTIVGAGAASTLTTGTGNIVIGQGSDVALPATSDNLIIGTLLQGDLANDRLGIGFSAGTDVSLFNDALEVNGNGDFSGALNVTGTSTFGDNMSITGDTSDGSTNPLSIEDSSASVVFTVDSNGRVDASDFFIDGTKDLDPGGTCGAGNFSRWDGNSWQCDADGTGGGDGVGGDGLPEVLANDPSANNITITDVADPSNAQDAATKNYVDTQLGSLSSDRIEDNDGNTYIDVDTAGDGSANTTIFQNAGTESARIDATGNLGLGTTTPTNKLTILDGNIAIREDDDGNNAVIMGAGLDVGWLALHNAGVLNTYINSAVGAPSYFNAGGVVFGDTTIDASAYVEMESTSRGFLTPRMTVAQRDAIAAPATGLLVFATDAGDGGLFQFYDGGTWVDVGAGGATGAGLWTEDGTNNYIEYDDTLGGVRIGRVTGQPAPNTDWELDTANSVVYTTANTLAIGSGTVSGALQVDVTGAVGAAQYCDADGNNCFTAATVASGGSGLWTDDGTYISYDNAHILDTGAALDAALDDNGKRFFYYENKSALRGGEIVGGNAAWQDANIGLNSVAWGLNPRAIGYASTAFGDVPQATGQRTVAMGYHPIASGDYSTAIGRDVTSSGYGSTALGFDARAGDGTASDGSAPGTGLGDYSIALGAGNSSGAVPQVTGDSSVGIFMGDQAGVDISSSNLMAIMGGDLVLGSPQLDDEGSGTYDRRMLYDASKGAFRVGEADSTHWDDGNRGNLSIALGEDVLASGDNSIAIGRSTRAIGGTSFAIGQEAHTQGARSITFGLGNPTDGQEPILQGDEAFAIFMGAQDGVVLTQDQQMSILGGNIVIDPAIPATQLIARTALDVGAATDAFFMPVGTVAQRPATPLDGMFRFNSENDAYEVYSATATDWIEIVSNGALTGSVAGNDTEVQFNDAGSPGADPGLTYDQTTDTLNVASVINVGEKINIAGFAGAAPSFADLNDLDDVSVAGPTDGYVLSYNSGSGSWVAIDSSTLTTSYLDRIQDTGDGNTYIDVDTDDADGNNTVSIFTAGAERMRLTNAGDLGLGTNDLDLSGIATPFRLRVAASNAKTVASESTLGFLGTSENNNPIGLSVSTVGGAASTDYQARISALEAGVSPIDLILQATGGDVGIGTTSPGLSTATQALTVSDLNTNGTAAVELQGNISGADGEIGGLGFYNNGTLLGGIGVRRINADNSGSMIFTTTNAGTETEAMRITRTGNVGIGTNSPSSRLEVIDTQASPVNVYVANGSADAGGSANFLAATDAGLVGIGTTTIAGGAVSYLSSDTAGGLSILNEDATASRIVLQTGVTATPRLIVDHAGLVGIGTVSPSAILDIAYPGGTGPADPAILRLMNTTNQGSAKLQLLEQNTTQGFELENFSSTDGNTNYLALRSFPNNATPIDIMRVERDTGHVKFINSPVSVGGPSSSVALFELVEDINDPAGSDGVRFEYDGAGNLFHLRSGFNGTFTERLTLVRDSGSFGIGTTTPQTRFDINGTLKIADGGEACDANREGAIRYDGTGDVFYFCATAASGWEAISLGSGVTELDDLSDAYHDIATDFDGDTNDNDDNLALGHTYTALDGTTPGARNTAIGATALDGVTTGDNNIAVGYDAGTATTAGSNNVLMGRASGAANTAGNNNVYIGDLAGTSNDSSANTVIGYQAGQNMTGGTNNTYFGYQAGVTNVSGDSNIMIGIGTNAPTGITNDWLNIGDAIEADMASREVFIDAPAAAPADGDLNNGAWTLWLDEVNDEFELKAKKADGTVITQTVGSSAGAIAINDLSDAEKDTTNNNLFMAEVYGSALTNNTQNTGVGIGALDALTNSAGAGEGDENTAFGFNALTDLTTGSSNVAIGSAAGGDITTATDNTAIGVNAGRFLTSGSRNVAIGRAAGSFNETGNNNITIGVNAGQGTSSSSDIADNIIIGFSSAIGIQTGANLNTIMGHSAATALTDGTSNTLIGQNTGDTLTTGDFNIMIGAGADVSAATASNELNIGNVITGDLANSVVRVEHIAGFPEFQLTSNNTTLPDYSGSSSVGTVANSNIFGRLTNNLGSLGGVTTGGMLVQGFTNSSENAGFPLDISGSHGGTAPTTPAVRITGQKHSGTDNRAGLADNEIIMDVANGYDNATPLVRIMGDGAVGIGTASPAGSLHVVGDNRDMYFDSINATDSEYGPDLQLRRSRAGAIVAENDKLGGVRFYGHDGVDYRIAGRILVESDGTPGTNDMPGRMEFDVTADGQLIGDGAVEMVIKNTGFVGIGTETPNGVLDVEGSTFFLPGDTAAPADVDFANSQWTLWLDETNDEFELKAKKADGSIITQTVGTSAGAIAISDLTDAINDTTTNFDGDANDNDDNIALGHKFATLDAGTPGARNTAIGTTALDAITTGDGNIGIGYDAGTAITSGTRNTLLGKDTGLALITQTGNTFLGWQAGRGSTGNSNIAIGSQTMNSTVTGDENVFVGQGAGQNASGNVGTNVAVGYQAGLNLSGPAANSNVLIGWNSGATMTDSIRNTAIGYNALSTATTDARENTVLGYFSGTTITTGDNNILIGNAVNTTSATASNELNIGDTIYGDLSTGALMMGQPALESFTNSAPLYQFYAETSTADMAIGTASSSTPTAKSDLVLFRARGTRASPTTVQDGDYVGSMRFSAYDGSVFRAAAAVEGIVTGAPSGGSVPTSLIFRTGDTGTGSERMRISNAGNVGIGSVAPDTLLHVYDAGDNPQIRLEGPGDSIGELIFEENGQGDNFVISYSGVNNNLTFTGNDGGTLMTLSRERPSVSIGGTTDALDIDDTNIPDGTLTIEDGALCADDGGTNCNDVSREAGSIYALGTGSILMPAGTTAQRPSGIDGMIRFNNTTDSYEVYSTTAGDWVAIVAAGAVSGGSSSTDTQVIYNDSGTLSGEAAFTYDQSNDTMTIASVSATDRLSLTPKTSVGTPNGLAINDLTDVNAGSATDGQVLTYDNASGNWLAQDAGSGSSLWTDLTGGRIHYGTTSANQVGVAMNNPAVSLDVGGTIRFGDGGETCSAAYEGALRYVSATSELQMCNGTDWVGIVNATGATGGGCTDSQTYSTPGEYTFTVDASNFGCTFKVRVYGAAGDTAGAGVGGAAEFDYTPAAMGDFELYVGEKGVADSNLPTLGGGGAGDPPGGNSGGGASAIGFNDGSFTLLMVSGGGGGDEGTGVPGNGGSLNSCGGDSSDGPQGGCGNVGGSNDGLGGDGGSSGANGSDGNGNPGGVGIAKYQISGGGGGYSSDSAGGGGGYGGGEGGGSGGAGAGGGGYVNSAAVDNEIAITPQPVDTDGRVEIVAVSGSPTLPAGTVLNDLADTAVPAPNDGDVLTWDNSSSRWVGEAVGGAGAIAINDLIDAEKDITNNNLFMAEVYGSPLTNNTQNTSVGIGSLDALTNTAGAGEGDDNTALGYNALTGVTTGSSNVAMGSGAGASITSGSSNIIIGAGADVSAAAASNELNIGGVIKGDLANSVVQIENNLGFPQFQLTSNNTTLPDYSNSSSVGSVSTSNVFGRLTNNLGTSGTATTGGMLVQGFTNGAENAGFPLDISGSHGGTAPTTPAVRISGQKHSGVDNRSAIGNDEIVLDVVNNYDSATPLMRIMGDGDVGIGLTAPLYKLHIQDGDIAIGDTTDSPRKLFIQRNGAMVGKLSADDSDLTLAAMNGQDIRITPDGGITDGGIFIADSGNVGIGNTTPATRLSLGNGSLGQRVLVWHNNNTKAGFGVDMTGSSWEFNIFGQANGSQGHQSFGFISSTDGTTYTEEMRLTELGYLGIGNTSPDVELDVTGDIEYTGTITDVSDARLKDNIEPLNKYGSLLERIDQIETVSFVMKDDEDKRKEFGVIAQQLETVFPELVHTAKDDMGTKSVNYVGLIAPMIEATKELKDENAALKTELETIRSERENVQEAVAKLTKQVDLLNKTASNKAEKASILPLSESWMLLLIGFLSGLCIVLVVSRKKHQVG